MKITKEELVNFIKRGFSTFFTLALGLVVILLAITPACYFIYLAVTESLWWFVATVVYALLAVSFLTATND